MSADPSPIRVMLVDDHPVFRTGLVSLLRTAADMVVVGQAGSGAAALRMWQHCRPDVCLLDLYMPELDGLETLKLLQKAEPQSRVLFLTSSEAAADADRAMAAGACGYVAKNVEHDSLLDTIRRVFGGARGIRCGVSTAAAPLQRARQDGPLSPRELEVLHLLRDGLTTAAIATSLGITHRTVKFHIAAILEKLNAADRMGAIVKAFDLGLLQPSSR